MKVQSSLSGQNSKKNRNVKILKTHIPAEADRVCDRISPTIGDRTLQNLSNFLILTQRSPADSYNRLSIAEIFVL